MGLSTLSWIVLGAGICNGIRVAFIFLAIAVAVVGGVFMLCAFDSATKDAHRPFQRRMGIVCFVLVIVFSTIAAITPSEKAVYMVAGIELVNQFSKTETAKELGASGVSIVNDITQIIHNYAVDGKSNDRK